MFDGTNFQDKVALVTGGASGIGLALANAFADRGAKLVLADLDRPALESVRAEFVSRGTEVLAVVTDVTDKASVAALADETYTRFGHVDILCNNAGVATFGSMVEATQADWDFTMGVNVWGVVNGVQAFVPNMVKRGEGGYVVNTASMAGLIGMEYLGVYCMSKFAVVGMTESLARELRSTSIGVSLLCPMVVDTPINENSVRMRPDHLSNPQDVSEPDMSLVGGVVGAEEVADRVLAAMAERDLYILTHPEQAPILEKRAQRLAEAAAKVLA